GAQPLLRGGRCGRAPLRRAWRADIGNRAADSVSADGGSAATFIDCVRVRLDHAVGTRLAADAKTGAAPAGAGRRGTHAALGAVDPGARRARPRALGSRAGAAGRRVGGPRRFGIEPGGPVLSADAPSRRLSLSRFQLTICATAAATAFGVR